MTQASTKAFTDLKESGKLSKQGERIINALCVFGKQSTQLLSNGLSLPHSTVTARISGLREKGYVKEAGKSGKYTLWSYVSDPNERKQVAHEYRRKRFIATAERMLNEYRGMMSDRTYRWLQDDVDEAKHIRERWTVQTINT